MTNPILRLVGLNEQKGYPKVRIYATLPLVFAKDLLPFGNVLPVPTALQSLHPRQITLFALASGVRAWGQIIIHYIGGWSNQGMQQDSGFNFLAGVSQVQSSGQFKRERQVYLAERNARKLQAQALLRRDRASSSSSLERPVLAPVPRLLKEQKDCNTDSSNSPAQDDFKQERKKYTQERMARRQEAAMVRRKEFGSSSSEEKDEITIRPRALKPPHIKVQRVPFKEESSPFGFASLEVQTAMRSVRELRESRGLRESSGLLSSVRLKDKHSQRRQVRQRFEVQVPSKKGVNVWLQRWLQFRETAIQLAERTIPLYDIIKVKLMASPTPSGSLRIKLTLADAEEVFLAVNGKRINEVHFLDQYYFVFARLITLKLQIMGRRPQPISRVREGVSQQVLREARLAGKVRKSSFFGGWEEKIGVVGSEGLALYRAGKDEAGLSVPPGSVRELWTRFDFDRENLVVKFLNGGSKVELSVPCEDFLCRENWLYQIYSLAPK